MEIILLITGNAAPDEIPNYYKNSLVPTVATMEFLSAWVKYWTSHADKVIYVKMESKIETTMK